MALVDRIFHAGTRLLHRHGHDHGHGSEAPPDPSGMGMSGETYDRLSGLVLHRLYRTAAREVLTAPAGTAVLDVGTGTARLLRAVAARRTDLALTGADISPKMLDVGRRALAGTGHTDRVRLDVADAARLPYPDGSFGIVVSTLSLHHWPMLEPALAEIMRVLRPGGHAVIYDFRASQVRRVAGLIRGLSPDASVSEQPVSFAGWLPLPLFVRVELRLPGAG